MIDSERKKGIQDFARKYAEEITQKRQYCEQNGHDYSTKESFGRNIKYCTHCGFEYDRPPITGSEEYQRILNTKY